MSLQLYIKWNKKTYLPPENIGTASGGGGTYTDAQARAAIGNLFDASGKALKDIDMESKKLVDTVAPTADLDGSTKKYVDDNEYADANAVSAMGIIGNANPLNHNRYADANAVSAMGVIGNANPLNHNRYADANAVSAMGIKGNANSLNHDRYLDSEARTSINDLFGSDGKADKDLDLDGNNLLNQGNNILNNISDVNITSIQDLDMLQYDLSTTKWVNRPMGYPELGMNKVVKEITFNNDVGTLALFTVTGDARVNIIAICKTNLASAALGNIRLGVIGNTNAMINDTLASDLDANEFWNDQSPTDVIQVKDRVRGYDISNGNDIILTLDAQIDSGAITFYCYWIAHSNGASVVGA